MEKPAGPDCLPDMTAFTTSSPLFQQDSLWKHIIGETVIWVSVTCTFIHLYVCFGSDCKRSSREMSSRWLKTIRFEKWMKTSKNYPEGGKQRKNLFFFCRNELEAMKTHSENHFHLCRRNLGSLKWDSHQWNGDSLSLLYTLSILLSVGLCKHKKC